MRFYVEIIRVRCVRLRLCHNREGIHRDWYCKDLWWDFKWVWKMCDAISFEFEKRFVLRFEMSLKKDLWWDLKWVWKKFCGEMWNEFDFFRDEISFEFGHRGSDTRKVLCFLDSDLRLICGHCVSDIAGVTLRDAEWDCYGFCWCCVRECSVSDLLCLIL